MKESHLSATFNILYYSEKKYDWSAGIHYWLYSTKLKHGIEWPWYPGDPQRLHSRAGSCRRSMWFRSSRLERLKMWSEKWTPADSRQYSQCHVTSWKLLKKNMSNVNKSWTLHCLTFSLPLIKTNWFGSSAISATIAGKQVVNPAPKQA